MSNKNHKNHTNYNKISTTPAVVEQLSVETTPAVVDSTTSATSSAPVEPIDGIVSGCRKLNIRKEPSLSGEVICEVYEGVMLMIAPDASTNEWFRVYTEAGVEGYCMKKFVTIKS